MSFDISRVFVYGYTLATLTNTSYYLILKRFSVINSVIKCQQALKNVEKQRKIKNSRRWIFPRAGSDVGLGSHGCACFRYQRHDNGICTQIA